MMKLLRSLPAMILSVGALVHLCSCQSGLEYTDTELAIFDSTKNGKKLSFSTSKGNQLAFYVAPSGGAKHPDPLIILFPGIGSKALDRLDWVKQCPDPQAGFLLVDYPGRGRCDGTLQPSKLPDTTDGAMNALADYLQTDKEKIQSNLRIAGHSFGCGAALQFAARVKVRSIVLLAPFTTMKKALFRKMGPLAWLIPENLDNRKHLRAVVANAPVPSITIIHGTKDSTIPFSMGSELHQIAQDKVSFVAVEGGSHVSILTTHRNDAFSKLLKD